MMNTEKYRIYNEKDIKLQNDGIFLKNTFFSKKDIADTFNELTLMNDFIKYNFND